ncbi:MAG TPA: type IV pilin protein [Burkholderiales bacterium]
MVKRVHRGFTLIELMIVVVVISVLAGIAIPSYSAYVKRGKRAAARTAVQNTAQMQERYFSQNNGYLAVAAGGTPPAGWVNYVGDTYANRYYDLTVTVGAGTPTTAANFTISAVPANGFTDTPCGTLSLTSAGLQSPTTPAECWQR